jgi:hypothetical protein
VKAGVIGLPSPAASMRAVMARPSFPTRRRRACLLAGACFAAAAHAAHPLQTEDTGTQGTGNVEIENGASWTHQGEMREFVFQPQVSVGASATVDLILQPAWQQLRDDGGAGAGTDAGPTPVSGFGDTHLDVKWRFFGRAPWSVAIRAGASLPTAAKAFGPDSEHTTYHAVLVATLDAAPWSMHFNVGDDRNPGGAGVRHNAGHASAAAMWAVDERLTLAGELGMEAGADPSAPWDVTVLGGAIWTLRPGLDFDAGWQTGVRTAPGSAPLRVVLLGLTWRFGL